MTVLTKRDWHGQEWLQQEYLPPMASSWSRTTSWFDPIALSHILWNNGRPPRFLAKEKLFHIPSVGQIVGGAGQIPVFRETENAADSVRAAVDAGPRRRGRCRLSGGDHHARPGFVADDREDRGGEDRPARRRAGDPHRAVGCARRHGSHAKEFKVFRPRPCRCGSGRPWTSMISVARR